jgi:hypothetical protein
MWMFAAGLLVSGCSEKKLDPDWLKDQTAIVDAVCGCTEGLESTSDKDAEYYAQLGKINRCIDSKHPLEFMNSTTASGHKAGVKNPHELPEVRELEARMDACQGQLAERMKLLDPETRRRINAGEI